MLSLNRFFVSESFRSGQEVRRKDFQNGLNRFFVSESFRSQPGPTWSATTREVSIASSSANHSGRNGTTRAPRTYFSLNRFFVSESFRSSASTAIATTQRPCLNRFFVSESFRSRPRRSRCFAPTLSQSLLRQRIIQVPPRPTRPRASASSSQSLLRQRIIQVL